MTRTFKDIFFGYLAAIAAVLALAFFVMPAGLNRWIRLALVLIPIAALALLATWLTQKRIVSFNEPLENCRMREGIEKLRGVIDKTLDENSRLMFTLNEATAYNDLGEYKKALEVLNSIKVPEKHSPREMYLQSINQYEKCRAYTELGDLEEAGMHLSTLNYILGDLKFREPMLSRMIRNAKMAARRIKVLQDDLDGAYEAYKGFVDDAESLRVIVGCRYHLAAVCIEEGRDGEALENLEFIAKYGGDTVYAEEAREYLKDLEAGGEDQ